MSILGTIADVAFCVAAVSGVLMMLAIAYDMAIADSSFGSRLSRFIVGCFVLTMGNFFVMALCGLATAMSHV